VDADVIVVGAGPVGLFLAAELRLGGAEALVVERLTAPATDARARGIGALATEALWRRGLGPQLAAAHHEGTRDLARHHGSTLGHFANIHKLVPDPERPGTSIWQPELERLLAAHAEALCVRILRGHEVDTIEPRSDGIVVGTAAGHRLHARYLVGCDGGRSTVRTLAGFGFPGTPPLLRTIAGRVHLTGDIPPAGRYGAGTFLRGGDMAGVSEPAVGPEPSGPVTAAELSDAIRRVTGADVAVTDLRDARRFSDHARQADTYRSGRVLLAGDAAHVHSPSGGQGLNLGLLDAANLGWKLAAIVRGDAPDGLLDTYTRERHPAGEAVLHNTRAQSALLTPGPHVDALREIVAELMDIPEANRYFTELLSGVNLRYEFPYPPPDAVGQHAVGRHAVGRHAVGRHCPDLELVDDDGTRSMLHAHARSGRPLLLLPPRTRELAACATGRADVVPVTNTDPLLIRPDGVVAWAAGDRGSLDTALDTWFGRRTDEFLPSRRSKARISRHPR
jgi:2-polyprenyl-6-methoxyphenol hydroxylase-like FAD-dependent oxidoreductase